MSDEGALIEPEVAPEGDEFIEQAASLWGDAWRELRQRWIFWIAASLIALFSFMAAAPQVFVAPSPATHIAVRKAEACVCGPKSLRRRC